MEGACGLRVLEVGERLGTAAAGLALTALGAEVAQLRLAQRQVRGPEATYYDRGRVVVEGADGWAELAAQADVILTDLDTGALSALSLPTDERALRRGERSQVLVVIRSLGRTGPSAGFRMTDLTEWASGGLATVTRRLYPEDPERYVPVVPPGFQPQALAGLAAASGAFAGLRWARARREPVVVDVSVQEVMAATLHSIFPPFVWNGHVLGHPDTPSNALGLLLPALDGDVYIRTVEAHQWDKLMDWLGQPEWGEVLGGDPTDRLANLVAIRALVGEWTSSRTRAELLAEGQRRKVPIALPRSLDDVHTWPQLRARHVWREVNHDGIPAEIPRLPIMEPAAWTPTRHDHAAAVVARWGGR
jgi:benzylsuccinate CoA-transferase BbsE subunit